VKALSIAFLVACLFPYTQFLPIETYTQPYALIFGILMFAVHGRRMLEQMPRADALVLLGLAFAGAIAFCIDCLPAPNEQELKYLLIYVSPLVLGVAGFAAFHDEPVMARRVVSIAVVVWLVVGVVQTAYDPNFMASYVGVWQESVDVVITSGRGVLGLAPEPTHYGFHLIVMAGILTLLGGSRILIWGCILGAVLLARSSSAALALLLGAGLFTLQMPIRYKVPILTTVALLPFLVFWLLERFDPESSRLLFLAGALLREPTTFLQIDYSVNVRLGGLIASVMDSLERFLLPHGLSHDYWMDHSRNIIDQYPWLLGLSDAGPPSGFGIVIYQLGFIGLTLLVKPVSRLWSANVPSFDKLVVLAAMCVFIGQYYISTPGFSLMYGAAIGLAMRTVAQRAGHRVKVATPATAHTVIA
jgi:hypothetical protein